MESDLKNKAWLKSVINVNAWVIQIESIIFNNRKKNLALPLKNVQYSNSEWNYGNKYVSLQIVLDAIAALRPICDRKARLSQKIIS